MTSIMEQIVNDIYHRPRSTSSTSLHVKYKKLRTLYVCLCCTANFQGAWKNMTVFRGVDNHLLALNKGINMKEMTPLSGK